MREVRITQSQSRTIQHRSTYTGAFTSTVVTPPAKKNLGSTPLPTQTTSHQLPEEPKPSYSLPIPIPKAKCDDLQVLKKYCRVEAH